MATPPMLGSERARRWALLAVGALGGAAVADAAWHGAVQTRALGAPPGWVREASQVPYKLSDLSGDLRHAPGAWSLEFWQALTLDAGDAPARPASVAATVSVPEGGQVELWTADARRGAESGGVALVAERIGTPETAVVWESNGLRRALDCTATWPAVSDGAIRLSIAPVPGGVTATVGETTGTCTAAVAERGPAVRPGLRRVLVRDLEVGGEPLPAPGPGWRPLWWLSGAVLATLVVLLELWLGSALPLVALTTAPLLAALALDGRDLRLWAETARVAWFPAAWLGAAVPAGLAATAKILHHLARKVREAPLDALPADVRRDWPAMAGVAAILPLALAMANSPGVMDSVLVVAITAAAAIPVGLLVPPLLRLLGSRFPRRSAALLLAFGTLAGALAAASDPFHRVAIPLFAGAGLSLGLVVWANANARTVRALNLVSLAGVAGVAVLVESGLRYTEAGVWWAEGGGRLQSDDIFGWVPTAWDEFARFEGARHTAYPDKGYPVAVTPDDGRVRLVAMGGSTTGGAWQNDDLAEFYPARLAERLGPGFQVVNQGVGGWTTWHIRRYVQDHLDLLAPDVLTLYVGHNDILTPVPLPYSRLYESWRSQAGPLARTSQELRRLRLYQGLRYFLAAWSPAARRVAVPVDEARDNLTAIADLVTSRQGRVVLMSEGLAPDPGPLLAYDRMMAELAAGRDGVSFLDTAATLHAASGVRVFLDDCHLTDAGHRLVADALLEELQRLGIAGASQ